MPDSRVQERYDPVAVEARWLRRWDEEELYRTPAPAAGQKTFYQLEMFPYPSGELHMGHVRNYSIGDVMARFRRMQGHAVLHPMGFDAFGMPAENAAIERGVDPNVFTERNIERVRTQCRRMGWSYDWSREVVTSHPDYYRWTQWLFLLFYERGLAYRKEASVNYCPVDETVLANEQVEDGRCWRCGAEVEQRRLNQWFFRITAYADRLLDDIALLDGWPERIRLMQTHWIGRSQGAEVKFTTEDGRSIPVFTTRPDTLFGVTFLVLAPEHPLVETLVDPAHRPAVEGLIAAAGRLAEFQRASEETEKIGVPTGAFARHPLTGELVPILVGNYVLMSYGTGAVMGVPAHDTRDFAFARRYGLTIRPVIAPPPGVDPGEGAYTGEGVLVNSPGFDGMASDAARAAIVAELEARGMGQGRTTYHLRDWLISRQRYWGAPIPMIHCPRCDLVPVPVEALPVLLPPGVRFGHGSPLAEHEPFWRTTCPRCGGPARRETDTMDTFVDSSWYFLRFCSPHDDRRPFDPEAVERYMPVDEYVGGPEHAVLHLLYARFFQKVLFDAGLTRVTEPFHRLFTQGMLVQNGAKMSKSKGNIVSPEAWMDRVGADATRVHMLFAGPPDRDVEWVDPRPEGAARFLGRLWRLGQEKSGPETPEAARAIRRIAAHAVKKVTEDIERHAFNTAIAALMEAVRDLLDQPGRGPAFSAAVRDVVRLTAPFAPFITEAIWRELLGEARSVHLASWPVYDPEDVRPRTSEVVIQVNGRVRDRIEVPVGLASEELERAALARERIVEALGGRAPRRVVVIPDRLVNVVADAPRP